MSRGLKDEKKTRGRGITEMGTVSVKVWGRKALFMLQNEAHGTET